MNAAELIHTKKDYIIDQWTNSIYQNIPEAKSHIPPVLENSIPSLLDSLVRVLHTDTEDSKMTSFKSKIHGKERARKTNYTVLNLIKEYHLLKTIIFEVLDTSEVAVNIGMRDKIMYTIDEAIEDACEIFYKIRHAEREQAKEVADDLLSELETQGAMRDNFIASVSHDLRGPLNNTLQLVELLEDHLNSSNDAFTHKLFSGIKRSTHKGNELISNLLDVNLIQAGNPIPLHPSESDLLQEVNDAIETLTPSIKEKVSLECEHPEVLGKWDTKALCRALDNLISNAYKYGIKDGNIIVTIEQLSQHTLLSVHNTGNPIPKEQLSKLMDLYFRAENQHTKGWGLGLTLVKGIVDAHQGDLKVESSIEHGTTFTMKVPNEVKPKA